VAANYAKHTLTHDEFQSFIVEMANSVIAKQNPLRIEETEDMLIG
jgi:hypothetical protein